MWQKYNTFVLALVVLAICQHALTAVVNDTPKAAPRAFYPNFVLLDNYYYVGLYQRVNWHRATQICGYHGLALAQISSNKETELLQTHLTANGVVGAQFWLSANDLAKTGEFSWLSGSPVLYSNWGTNTTSCPVGAGHCVRTLPSFQWTVDDCQTEHYFICMEPVNPLCGINNTCKRRV